MSVNEKTPTEIANSYPSCNILVREKENIHVFDVSHISTASIPNVLHNIDYSINGQNAKLTSITSNAYIYNDMIDTKSSMMISSPIYSHNGNILAFTKRGINSTIRLFDTKTDLEICKPINIIDIGSDIVFSPLDNYIITWSNYKASINQGNLKIFQLPTIHSLESEVTLVCSFVLKVYQKHTIQFTNDEKYVFHLHQNEVRMLELNTTSNEYKIYAKISLKNVSQFQISNVLLNEKTNDSFVYITTFVPEMNGKPAFVSLYSISYSHINLKDKINTEVIELSKIISRTIFAANEVNFLWHPKGLLCLIHSHADVDKSNSSYYGTTGLYYIQTTIADAGQVREGLVPLSKEGAVHDVSWSPNGDYFITCSGNMPSQSTLYNPKLEKVYEFGSLHRNTISWSPHSRFVAIAGFGNLAGEVDFYDIIRLRKIGTCNAHATVSYGWSPDSRHFLTATVAPRMNVDNGFKIFKYNGGLPVIEKAMNVTYDVLWKPTALDVYPNRGPSPKREVKVESNETSSQSKPVVAAYRPPGSSGSLADMMRREKGPVGKVKKDPVNTSNNNSNTTSNTKKATSVAFTPAPRKIPGLPPSQTPSNNNKKK